jgi:hypothetical protein
MHISEKHALGLDPRVGGAIRFTQMAYTYLPENAPYEARQTRSKRN